MAHQNTVFLLEKLYGDDFLEVIRNVKKNGSSMGFSNPDDAWLTDKYAAECQPIEVADVERIKRIIADNLLDPMTHPDDQEENWSIYQEIIACFPLFKSI